MKKYEVEIVETLSRVITVEAESEDEALTIVWGLYDDGEVVLNYSDHIDTDLNIFEG